MCLFRRRLFSNDSAYTEITDLDQAPDRPELVYVKYACVFVQMVYYMVMLLSINAMILSSYNHLFTESFLQQPPIQKFYFILFFSELTHWFYVFLECNLRTVPRIMDSGFCGSVEMVENQYMCFAWDSRCQCPPRTNLNTILMPLFMYWVLLSSTVLKENQTPLGILKSWPFTIFVVSLWWHIFRLVVNNLVNQFFDHYMEMRRFRPASTTTINPVAGDSAIAMTPVQMV